jgi:hypothetical protein
MTHVTPPVRGIARAGYLIGALLIILPLVDALPVLFSPHVSDVRWRLGAAGILSGALMTPLFGTFVLMVAAAVLEHRRRLRILAWLCLVLAVVLTAAGGMFALDFLEVRHLAPEASRTSLTEASIKALVKFGLGALVAAGYGLVVLRATRVHLAAPALDASMLVGRS